MNDEARRTLSRRSGLRLGLGAGVALAALSLPLLPALAEDAAVLGLRSAPFGLSGDAVETTTPELPRTKVLRIKVSNLIEDSGDAVVTYVLGYQSQRLFRVNVVWGTPVNPDTTAAQIKKI